MPASAVKTKRDERLWEAAKQAATEQGRSEDWAYIMGIYQRMKGGGKKRAAKSVLVLPLRPGSPLAKAAVDRRGRTIGARLEAAIHQDFTMAADRMRGAGVMTREERIQALGAALRGALEVLIAGLDEKVAGRRLPADY